MCLNVSFAKYEPENMKIFRQSTNQFLKPDTSLFWELLDLNHFSRKLLLIGLREQVLPIEGVEGPATEAVLRRARPVLGQAGSSMPAHPNP